MKIPTPIYDRLRNDVLKASTDLEYKPAVDALMAGAREFEQQIISGFYEEAVPIFAQGSPTHELQSVVMAEEVAALTQILVDTRKLFIDLFNEVPGDTQSRPAYKAAAEAISKW